MLATASSDERLEKLKPLGLDAGINYKRDDVVQSVMKLTGNNGVNLVVDSVGGSTLQGFDPLAWLSRPRLGWWAPRAANRCGWTYPR